MDRRVQLNWLLDFYGALLTENRREITRLYLEEDLSLQEIADAMGITRQGVHDALNQAEKKLAAYEEKLGLLARYQRARQAIALCRARLDAFTRSGAPEALQEAREALDQIEDIER